MIVLFHLWSNPAASWVVVWLATLLCLVPALPASLGLILRRFGLSRSATRWNRNARRAVIVQRCNPTNQSTNNSDLEEVRRFLRAAAWDCYVTVHAGGFTKTQQYERVRDLCLELTHLIGLEFTVAFLRPYSELMNPAGPMQDDLMHELEEDLYCLSSNISLEQIANLPPRRAARVRSLLPEHSPS